MLVWNKTEKDPQKRSERAQMREIFLRNLEEEGLEVEYDIRVRLLPGVLRSCCVCFVFG